MMFGYLGHGLFCHLISALMRDKKRSQHRLNIRPSQLRQERAVYVEATDFLLSWSAPPFLAFLCSHLTAEHV